MVEDDELDATTGGLGAAAGERGGFVLGAESDGG